MARGDKGLFGGGSGGSFGDQNNDGIDDNFDRQPGSRGRSPEYDRLYNPRSENEFTNLPEVASQARYALQDEELGEQAEQAKRNARNFVHYFPSVGKFIIPEENTWAAHSAIVLDNNSNLYFNPDKYVYFDKIIADKLKIPALYDRSHPDFPKYRGLRTNLEVIRNDIIGIYLHDGAFDPGDERHIPQIEGIATELGKALANDVWWKRPFVRYIDFDVANVEAVGAQVMYKYLLSRQTSGGPFPDMHRDFMFGIGATNRAWDLPALKETPYSDANLAAPPPTQKIKLTQSQLLERAASPDLRQQVGVSLQESGEQMSMTAETMLTTARKLPSVETLAVPTKEQSVEEARTILRWLRNLQFGDRDVETFLNQGTPAEQIAKTNALSKLVEIYGGQLALAKQEAPGRLLDLAIFDANEAAGAMAIGVAEHSISLLPDFHPRIAPLDQLIEKQTPESALRTSQSTQQLLDLLETGIERASGKIIDTTPPVDRLVQMSNKIQSAAYKLRSVDTLAAPARAESVELAREILRKLKNLNFAKQGAKEIIDTGRPEDKAEFAKKIGEMVEMYQNLLSEAAQTNPNIMNDPRVAEANQAVGSFAHTIKLMAAKEIPVSMAASQQISADITQMPEEWKGMEGRTMERLAQSMETGMERAASEIAAQQQAQQKDEDMAQEVLDQAMQQTSSRRKRRRRHAGGRTTPALPKSAKRRNSNDMNGDGVADKIQGLNLKGIDLAALKEIGGNLRAASNEAATLAPPAPVADETIRPDDKGFAERKTQRDEQNKNNPRSNRNRPQI